jgi:hypothetical protein
MHGRASSWVVGSLAALTVSSLVPSSAQAEDVGAVALQMGRATFSRARRMVALGPFVGAAPFCSFASDAPYRCDGVASFGLGLYLFKIPVLPSTEMIKDAVKRRVEERIKQTILQGQPPPGQDDAEKLFREVYEEVKAELLQGVRPKKVEKPLGKIVLETGYLMRAEAWQLRTTAGVGMGPVTVGPTVVGSFRDHTSAALGPEVAFHLTLGSGPRTMVLDIFARCDFVVTDRQITGDEFALGLRFLLDII